MDVYKIGVSIALSNGVSPILAIIGKDLVGLNTSIKKIEQNFGGWAIAIGAVGALLAGGAIVHGLVAIAKHGGEVNHQLEMMKTAGMAFAETQDAMAQAMKTSGNVLTTTLSENLKHIRELRYAFGETGTAIAHLDEISKSNAILNNIRGGGKDEVWELVKSLEMKGETYDPAMFSSYVNTMTRVVQATGGRVTPQDFMSTFKYGRTATLGWDEQFVGGALPRLMQSMKGGGSGGAGGPGNALMSAFAKVVQGQMPKTAAEEFERMGLGTARHITGSSESQIEGGIQGRGLFMANPYEWVQQVLMPALAAHGVTSQNDIITQVSKMFPVRTASQIITEMGLQGRFHEGAQSPFEKDIKLQGKGMGLPAYDELIKNDYPMVLQAFNQQWKNLLETLGAPMMAPGGPVIQALSGLASAMGSLAQAAGRNMDAIKGFMSVIGAMGSIAYEIGAVLAEITKVGAVFMLFGQIPWGLIQTGLDSVRIAISAFINYLASIPAKIGDTLKGLLGGDTHPSKGGGASGSWEPSRFNPARNSRSGRRQSRYR